MSTVPAAIQNLARRLIALELPPDAPEGPAGAARACEKLRGPLVKLAGVAGFRSLVARAVARATAEVPRLAPVQVRADGSLEGFGAAGCPRTADPCDEAGGEIVAHLLGLLVTFIGEPLTLGLVRDAWPDAPLGDAGLRAEGRP